MIHLERFNFFKRKINTDTLYKFISVYDALIYRSEHKIDVLSDSEIFKIKEVVKNPFSLTKVKFGEFPDKLCLSFRLRDIDFLIEKYNDDWYILNKHDMDNNVSNYLCDQFEGLIQCIKNEIRIF